MRLEQDFGPKEKPLPTHSSNLAERVEQIKGQGLELVSEVGEKEYQTGRLVLGEQLILTPWDDLRNVSIVRLPEEDEEKARQWRWHDLFCWNSLRAIEERRRLMAIPFRSPVKGNCEAIEEVVTSGRLLTFSELVATSPQPDSERLSRRNLDESGIWSWVGKEVRRPVILSSMPDASGSVMALAVAAMSGVLGFAPRNGIWSDIESQAELVSEAIRFLKDNPLLHSLGSDQEMVDFWLANLGTTVEPAEKALCRVEKLFNLGVRAFRVYSPEGGIEMVETVAELRRVFGNQIEIFAGQVMHLEVARRLENVGADAIFIGVGGGSPCTTAVNAGLGITTARDLYLMRGEISVPIVIDGGGVGDNVAQALILGASAVSKAGEITGGTIESPGGPWFLQKNGGSLYKPYRGEASPASKWLDGKIDVLGRPLYAEGVGGIIEFDPYYPTMTSRLRRIFDERIAPALIFQRASTIAELHQRDASCLMESGPQGNAVRYPYLKRF